MEETLVRDSLVRMLIVRQDTDLHDVEIGIQAFVLQYVALEVWNPSLGFFAIHFRLVWLGSELIDH
jgi:hypothetical protein